MSSLGRPVDPRFPSNKAILVVMAVAFVAGAVIGFIDTGAWGPAASSGLTYLLTAFTAWALGRELDPDRTGTAMLAVALAGVPLVVWGTADLWTLAVSIALARVVNRSIGPGARVTDLLAVLGLLGLAVLLAHRWTLGLAGAVALALDASLDRGTRDRYGWAAASLALVAIAFATGPLALIVPRHGFAITVVVLVVTSGIATLPPLHSPCDVPGHPLALRRVQGGVFVVLLVAVFAQFEPFEPGSDLPQALGVVGVLLATVVGRVVFRTRSSPQSTPEQ